MTSREADRVVYDHHLCLRCGAEKDTLRSSLAELRLFANDRRDNARRAAARPAVADRQRSAG